MSMILLLCLCCCCGAFDFIVMFLTMLHCLVFGMFLRLLFFVVLWPCFNGLSHVLVLCVQFWFCCNFFGVCCHFKLVFLVLLSRLCCRIWFCFHVLYTSEEPESPTICFQLTLFSNHIRQFLQRGNKWRFGRYDWSVE